MNKSLEPVVVLGPPEDGSFPWVEATAVTASGQAVADWFMGLTAEYEIFDPPLRPIAEVWMREIDRNDDLAKADGELWDALAWYDAIWVECRRDGPAARPFWKLVPRATEANELASVGPSSD